MQKDNLYQVYMVEHKTTGEVYIGHCKGSIKERANRHIYAANNGGGSNTALNVLLVRDNITNKETFWESYNLVLLSGNIETKEKAKFLESSYISFYNEVIEEAIVVNKLKPKEGFWMKAMLGGNE